MKEQLGDHINQAGSLVEEERLRFDFTRFSPLTPEEINALEQLVNRQIQKNTTLPRLSNRKMRLLPKVQLHCSVRNMAMMSGLSLSVISVRSSAEARM